MKKRLNLENLYAWFGKAHSSCLGILALNSPGYPKMHYFEPFFGQLWKVFLAFWVIVPHRNFGFRFVHFLRTNSPSGHLGFTFFNKNLKICLPIFRKCISLFIWGVPTSFQSFRRVQLSKKPEKPFKLAEKGLKILLFWITWAI